MDLVVCSAGWGGGRPGEEAKLGVVVDPATGGSAAALTRGWRWLGGARGYWWSAAALDAPGVGGGGEGRRFREAGSRSSAGRRRSTDGGPALGCPGRR